MRPIDPVIEHVLTPRGAVALWHDVTPAELDRLAIGPGLCGIVRDPATLRRILRALAADPRARLTLAVADGAIVGRAAVAPSFGRWRDLPCVEEFAIEVAREWRHAGLARQLTARALADPATEDGLLLAFTLPAAWDMAHERLSSAAYRARLAAFLGEYGFRPTGTDEPEVLFERDAALLVRVGEHVPAAAVAAFEQARYLGPVRRAERQQQAA